MAVSCCALISLSSRTVAGCKDLIVKAHLVNTTDPLDLDPPARVRPRCMLCPPNTSPHRVYRNIQAARVADNREPTNMPRVGQCQLCSGAFQAAV